MRQIIKAAFAASVMAVALNVQGAVNFTADPASGATLETLSTVAVTSTLGEVEWAELLPNTDQIKTYKDGEPFGGVTVVDGSVWTTFDLQLSPEFTEEGTYTIEIPTGILLGLPADEGDPFSLNDEPVTLTYTITGSEEPVTPVAFEPNTITPEPGTEIDLTYDSMPNIALRFNSNVSLGANPHAVLYDKDGTGYKQYVDIRDFSFAEKGLFFVLTSELDPQPSESGTYVLDVFAGSFTDGINESAAIKVEYNIVVGGSVVGDDVTVESIQFVSGDETIDLKDGVKLPALVRGDKIVFNTSDNLEVGYVTMTVKDRNPLNPDEAQRNFEAHALRTLQEPLGTYWTDEEAPFIEVYGKYVLQEGHTYDINYTLYDFENPPYARRELTAGSMVIEGSTKAYQYADIEVLSINPREGTTFHDADDANVTITFSGPVKINAEKSFFRVDYMQKELEGNFTMSDDNTVATLTYPASLLENAIGSVHIYLYVTDMEGHSLFFGYDNGDESHLILEYSCFLGTPELTVEPAAGIIEEFDHILVSYMTESGNQSIAWANNVDAGPVVLTDLGSKDGRVFGYIRNFETFEEGTVSDGMGGTNDGVISIIGYLENEAGERIKITTPGKYVLCIPAASFNMGDGFFGFTCKQTYINYTIEGQVADETIYDFTPSAQTVTFDDDCTLATVLMRFNDIVETNPDVINTVELRDMDDNKLDAMIENFYDMEDYNMWSFLVEYAFEQGKQYQLVIPQGAFGDMEWASDATYAQYSRGHANPEFSIYIEVPITNAVEGIDAEAGVKEIFNLQGMKVATTADLKTLPAGIYIIGGKKVVLK